MRDEMLTVFSFLALFVGVLAIGEGYGTEVVQAVVVGILIYGGVREIQIYKATQRWWLEQASKIRRTSSVWTPTRTH